MRGAVHFGLQASAAIDARARASGEPAIDLDTLVRSILFIAVFLAAWISFHPFISLAEPPPAVVEGGDVLNQIGYSSLFLALAAWTFCHQPRRLMLLARPVLLVTLLWCLVTIAASWEPSIAARRFAFTLVVMSISAMSLLLPKNLRHFSDLLAAVTLIVLLVCYLGVIFLPQLSIHQATDFLEPEHDGSWRGVFPHKNEAGATMVLFVFVGLYIARVRGLVLGGSIVLLAAVFLGFTQSKTAIGVLPLALALSAVIGGTRSPKLGVGLVMVGLILFNLFSVGTVMFEPIHRLVALIMPDATFTGRTDIWQIGLDAVARRPITGYGFSTFWGTEEVVYGLGETASWANDATDAHNAYLNLALTIGLPGMVLVVLWVVIMPIVDYCRGSPDPEAGPLQMLFLRVCLYAMFGSCFESSMFQQIGEVWIFYLTSTFGLRFLSLTRTTA